MSIILMHINIYLTHICINFYYLVHIEDLYIQVDTPDTSPFLGYRAYIYQMDSIQVHWNNHLWGTLHID